MGGVVLHWLSKVVMLYDDKQVMLIVGSEQAAWGMTMLHVNIS